MRKLYVEASDRIVVVGMPVSGKGPLAADLAGLYGLPLRHTDEIEGDWSEVSETASRWFDEGGGFVAAGMAVPRALRKWMQRNPEAARPYSVAVEVWEPRGEISEEQLRAGRGAETVWREVQAHFYESNRGDSGVTEQAKAEVAKSLRERERENWTTFRNGAGRTRFQRIGPPLTLEDGTMLPDFDIPARIKLQPASNDGGRIIPVDDLGRLWLQAYAVNPQEIVESFGIRIAWDAFALTMNQFRERPRMLAHHRMDQPIGNWPEQTMAVEGLTLRGFVSSARQDIQQLALDGVLDVSVSFFIDEAEFNEEENVLQVIRATLFEASLVAIPAMWSSFIDVAASWAKEEGGAAPVRSWGSERRLRGLRVNLGESLARALNRAIDRRATEETPRADIIEQMARAADISVATVNQILNGSINCPPQNRLEGFASVLRVSVSSLISAAENDGCSYGDEMGARCPSCVKGDRHARAAEPEPGLVAASSEVGRVMAETLSEVRTRRAALSLGR